MSWVSRALDGSTPSLSLPPQFINLLLFVFCSVIWGSTWLVIGYQVPAADPITSVFYRFSTCALLLFIFAGVSNTRLNFSWRHHRNFLFQGVFLFSLNFIFTYIAKTIVSSGIVAMAFTCLIYFNILGTKLYLREPPDRRVLLGSIIGGLGILIFFREEVQSLRSTSQTQLGIFLAILSTVCASIGNVLSSQTVQKGVPVAASNAWSMFYGSLSTLAMGLYYNQDFDMPLTKTYLLSFSYLVVFASLLTFGAYILLVKRIGPAKAAYCNMISPIAALGLASLFEGYVWTVDNVLGVIFCLIGSFYTLLITNSSTIKKRDPDESLLLKP